MFKYICFVLIGLQLSNVSAHEFLTEILVFPEDTISISPNSTINVIDTIYLTEQDLSHEQQKDRVKQEIKRIVAKRHRSVSRDSIVCDDWDGVFRTCGEFDDWNKGRSIAIDICTGIAVSHTDLYPDGLIPQFMGPSTFIHVDTAAPDHHNAYDFSDGLWFNCVEIISNLPTE